MDTKPAFTKLSPEDYAALMDAAKLRARTLRRQAVPAFWCYAGNVLATWTARAGRAACRCGPNL